MRFSLSATALVSGLAGLSLTSAHAVMDAVYVNGQPLGQGTALRVTKNNDLRVHYIASLESNDMACGRDGDEGVSRSAAIKGNDVLTFQWTSMKKKDNFPESHNGACSIMMKKVDDATTAKGSGDGWFRIFYEGYNKETKKWCTTRIMNGGMLSVRVPADLATGNYLVRSELLSLHNAHNNDPQFYVSCLQAVMTNGGTAVPKDTVALPSDEYAKKGTPSMKINLFWPPDNSLNYKDYGPPTYVASGPGGDGPVVEQTTGLRPTDAIFEEGNFHAFEIPTFTDAKECWAAHENCWEQSNDCYHAVLANNARCETWASKCKATGKICDKRGPFPGPVDAGKDMSPPLPKVDVPEPINDAGVTNSSVDNTESDEADEADETSSDSSPPSPSPASAPPPDEAGSDSEYGSGSDDSSDDKSGDETDSSSTTVDAEASSPSSSGVDGADKSLVTPAAESSCIEVVTETVTETATTTVRAQR